MPVTCDFGTVPFTEPSLKHLTNSYGVPKQIQTEYLQSLGKPHVDSFNQLIESGLHLICQNLIPVQLALEEGKKLIIYINDLRLAYPSMPDGSGVSKTFKIYPTECRQRKSTYSGHLYGKIQWLINDVLQNPIEKDFGQIPIMVKSNRCHLKNLTPAELIAKGEHEDEWGGYFIIKGNEKVVRMLLCQRRNYPTAISRRSWKQRAAMFSEKGIFIRCVAEDETATNNVLHFVNDGTAKLMISYQRSMYFIPLCLILKCLMNVTDLYIYKRLVDGREKDSYYKTCIKTMLQAVHIEGLDTHFLAKSYIGKTFRVKFSDQPSWMTDEQICDLLLEKCVAIHLKTNEEKFNLLVFMIQKLFAFVQNKCCEEGADALMMQEVLTAGNIYQQILKDKLQNYLNSLRLIILKKIGSDKFNTLTPGEMAAFCKRAGSLQATMENFLGTGNCTARYSSGIPQEKGLSVIAENINRMRYMSHFKAIHRGAFFVEMRTTEARQLLPDAWGFICPVHTPDGAPCGLLNHLSKYCEVTGAPETQILENIPNVLYDLGILPVGSLTDSETCYSVLLDGRVIGLVSESSVNNIVKQLRFLKIEGKTIPKTTEIVLVPKKDMCTQYPGLFLFTGPGRLIRPVKNLAFNKIELIGTFEQVYLDVCIKLKDAYKDITSHQELSSCSFLSNLACLIPMPDCNQSPRNMYQCQMGKQSMGTPCHTWDIQSETKLYRLLIPSSPLFRPAHYDFIKLDDFPMGVNAVVAVVSYTGYDMEDAMIINKSSFERGFGHGSILKSQFIDLKAGSYFERDPSRAELAAKLDEDGFPHPGSIIRENDPICCYFNSVTGKYNIEKYHSKEISYVDHVKLCSGNTMECPRACITFRVPRNPTVGDKFASRAGQKGICSQLWPAEDLPFTDSGMVPDVLFNPHGFPSRMTIAMMIELMAGKSAAVHGKVHDATPFRFSEENTAIDYFGKLLEAGGFSYYGTERMYSGVDGREMTASIFYGIVYYQRLRHMVLDKWQVRSTGAVDSITQQPIKGRRRGGGVRFGEMERDSLISHGASALVQDRLLDCSDKYKSFVCINCNNLISSAIARCPRSGEKKEICRLCPDGGKGVKIADGLSVVSRIMMAEKRGMKALELWCRRVTEGYPGVKIENMTTSWRDGLAFCALIHHFRPDLIDFDRLDKRDIYKNNELAFRIAERQLGIPALLDAEDMVEYEVPDRLSILTYLSQFYQTFVSNQQGTSSPSSRSHSSKVPEIISPSTKSQKTPKVAAGRLESCWSCRRPVFLAERLVAGGKLRHRTCFTCKRCGNQLNPVGYYETEDGDFVCETCPDEEKQLEIESRSECGDEKDGRVDVKDDYSLDFETALESVGENRRDSSKSRFLQDLVESSDSQRTMSTGDAETVDVFPVDGRSGKNVSDDQHSTASVEKLNVKIKNLLGRDFSDTLSLLHKESDSFLADISEIIDNIINDAVKKAESHVERSSDDESRSPREEVKQMESDDATTVNSIDASKEAHEEKESDAKENEPVVKPASNAKGKLDEYPKHLNPFGEDEDEEVEPVRPVVTPAKPPLPAARVKTARVNQSGQKIIEAPKVNLNPFWSEDEPSSDEDVKPVPAPRASLRQPEQDYSGFDRSQYGSFTSLNSVQSSTSVLRRKKGPAPMPPSGNKSPQFSEHRSPSPSPTIRSHRKSKPAPPPPQSRPDEEEFSTEKQGKNYENKVKQNLSFRDKSTYGKWKRKKGQAPGLPIPQRRRITPLPLPELYRELEDLEIQQRELERQGVTIEQSIRKYEAEAEDREEVGGKDVEGLILQLFEIVNRKNELFRRQAELMLLRRQQRLEEEHADIEYQIRCLMGRPERNKTDSDKAQEEELIRKLVEVVERRNEIIECLDMDRKREVEEDESIHHHLEAFAADKTGVTVEEKRHLKSSPLLLKYMRKKKAKKEKTKEPRGKVRKDVDKDLDEANKEEGVKTLKAKKKWFSKS